jgi:hypothetical protein
MAVSDLGGTIQLEPWRDGTDKDGRLYTITVVLTDKAGNQSTGTTTVLVPHCMRTGDHFNNNYSDRRIRNRQHDHDYFGFREDDPTRTMERWHR